MVTFTERRPTMALYLWYINEWMNTTLYPTTTNWPSFFLWCYIVSRARLWGRPKNSLVTVAHIPGPLPKCWQSQSDRFMHFMMKQATINRILFEKWRIKLAFDSVSECREWCFLCTSRVLVVVMRHLSKKLCCQLILWPWYFILLVKICVTIHYTTLKHRHYPTTW